MTLRELNRTLLAAAAAARARSASRAREGGDEARRAAGAVRAVAVRRAVVARRGLSQGAADGRNRARSSRRARLRTTLHVIDARGVPVHRLGVHRVAARAHRGARRRHRGAARGDPGRAADGARARSSSRQRVLGTDDRWTISFAYRALPFVRTAPLGPWPHTKPSPVVLGASRCRTRRRARRASCGSTSPPTGRRRATTSCSSRASSCARSTRRSSGCGRSKTRRGGRSTTCRARRSPTRDVKAPVRFLPAFDSIILAHRDRARIVPPEYVESVFNKKNATTKNTFTVDGFVAGAWRIEKGKLIASSRSRRSRRARGARSTPRARGCSPGISPEIYTAKSVSSGSRSPRSTARSTSTHVDRRAAPRARPPAA